VANAPIYTIGYGTREIDAFIAALRRYGVSYLIDVRSKPYSRYKPDFSQERLDEHLRRAGIRYVFMGDALGGRPDDPTCYDAEGKADYAQIAERSFFQAGIDRLMSAHAQRLPISLMCSEGKPENCHRSKLIGKTLSGRGVPMAHIDENDELIDQEAVLLRHTGGQRSLFGDEMLPSGSRKRYGPARGPAEDEEDG
jgi:uncharacterized protein (DUF488 family)